MIFDFPEEVGDIFGSKRHFHERPSHPLLKIVFEDEDLLVVDKPAGLVCHPTRHGPFSSIVGRARLHLSGEPGQPHLVNRLDRETSGLVVIAKNLPAAMAARALWLEGVVVKDYLAIVCGEMVSGGLLIDAPTGKDPESGVGIRNTVVDTGGKAARTFVRKLQEIEHDGRILTFVTVRIASGRKHQIRIHLEWAGLPILGDKIYGGDERCYQSFLHEGLSEAQRRFLGVPTQALHAWRLDLPWKDVPLNLSALPDGLIPWRLFQIPTDSQKTC